MLKKVRIKNFLSCEDTEFDLEQITVLIGRNAAGKTNILKTIQWVAQYAVTICDLSIFGFNEWECSIEFLINDDYFKYEIIKSKANFNNNPIENTIEGLFLFKNNSWHTIVEKNSQTLIFYSFNDEIIKININHESPILKSILSLLPTEKITPCIYKISDFLNKINYYDLESKEGKYNFFIEESEYIKWVSDQYSQVASKYFIYMRLLHLWKENKELLEELLALLGENGLNLINSIEIDIVNTTYIIRFCINGKYIHYYQLSYGTQRVLMILLALLYDKNSTLLIEQPEDGIHLGLLRKVLSICFTYAEAYNKQLIISTHSPKVINMFQPENIRLVKMTEHGTKVSCLDKERLPFVHEYIENEGALSDFIEAMDDE